MARPIPVPPGPGQKSVWDYPRPPRVDPDTRRVRIVCAGRTVVDTTAAVRVLETSHPPTWYVPVAALRGARLVLTSHVTWCEFKGRARYADIVGDDGTVLAADAAWLYPEPARGFGALLDRFTVYPGRVDACLVDEEQVRSQAGGFYGGWVTDDVVGPFKGSRGTLGW
jgi:uncharacterized protein (DUF427 family)